MLVLSRRLHQKILLPTVNATIEVVAVKPGVVRLGIDAPPDVTVLRAEVHERQAQWQAVAPPDRATAEARLRQLRLLVGNRLDVARKGLLVLLGQLAAGQWEDLGITAHNLDEDLELLQRRLGAEPKQPPPGEARANPPRALLVEDNANERELLATFLRGAGLEVSTAGDGCAALECLRSRGLPDVVLLDMGLPRCGGADVVRAVRQDSAYAGLKIFAVTGHREEDFDLARGPGGINRWFRKPIDPTDLVLGVEEELSRDLCRR